MAHGGFCLPLSPYRAGKLIGQGRKLQLPGTGFRAVVPVGRPRQIQARQATKNGDNRRGSPQMVALRQYQRYGSRRHERGKRGNSRLTGTIPPGRSPHQPCRTHSAHSKQIATFDPRKLEGVAFRDPRAWDW